MKLIKFTESNPLIENAKITADEDLPKSEIFDSFTVLAVGHLHTRRFPYQRIGSGVVAG